MRSSENEAYKVQVYLSAIALKHFDENDQGDISFLKEEAKKILCQYLELRMYNSHYQLFINAKDSFKVGINEMPEKFKIKDAKLFEDSIFLHKANQAFANKKATHANDFISLCEGIYPIDATGGELFVSFLDHLIKLNSYPCVAKNKSTNFVDMVRKIKILIEEYSNKEKAWETKKIRKLITSLKFVVYDQRSDLINSLDLKIENEVRDLRKHILHLDREAHKARENARNQKSSGYLPMGMNFAWYIDVIASQPQEEVDQFWTSSIKHTRKQIEKLSCSENIFLDYCSGKSFDANTAFNYIYALLMMLKPDREERIRFLRLRFKSILNEELVHKMFFLRQILPVPDDVRKYADEYLMAVCAKP